MTFWYLSEGLLSNEFRPDVQYSSGGTGLNLIEVLSLRTKVYKCPLNTRAVTRFIVHQPKVPRIWWDTESELHVLRISADDVSSQRGAKS